MTEKLKISDLRFKVGSTPSAAPLDVENPNVTVLVGPNNSGKSQTLKEIESWCLGENPALKILNEIRIEWPDTFEEYYRMLKSQEAAPPENQLSQPDHFWVARPVIRSGEREHHQQINENPQSRGLRINPLHRFFQFLCAFSRCGLMVEQGLT